VAEDVRASKAMHTADDAAAKGDATKALALIESDVKPAIEDGLRLADSAPVKTEWGKAKRDAIATVLRDRKNELPRYTEAVKSNDAEKMLSAMEAQAAIERRALAAVAGID
jgi:hypothetical protein